MVEVGEFGAGGVGVPGYGGLFRVESLFGGGGGALVDRGGWVCEKLEGSWMRGSRHLFRDTTNRHYDMQIHI